MAFLPSSQDNSETMQGELAYRRERLKKGAPSLFSTVIVIFVVPPLAAYWLVQWLYKRATGRSLPGPAVWSSARDRPANCAGSRRPSSGGPLARCSQCGKYIGLSYGRLLTHSR